MEDNVIVPNRLTGVFPPQKILYDKKGNKCLETMETSSILL